MPISTGDNPKVGTSRGPVNQPDPQTPGRSVLFRRSIGAPRASDRGGGEVAPPPDQATAKLVERWVREARALDRLQHPNIVKALGFGITQDGSSYLALELLRGVTLADELRTEPHPPLDRVLLDVAQVLNGLGAAHGLGLVHRDIKPSNVFAHRDEGGERVIKLLDFGLVKVLGSPAKLTTAGLAIGTPRYMSPEQASAGTIDGRSDLYSTALLLYRLVAGRGPFDHHRTAQDVLVARQLEAPPAPSAFAHHPLPRRLDEVILKGLEREPKDRFQSAAEFAEALVAIAHSLGGEALSMAFSSSARWVPSERTLPTMARSWHGGATAPPPTPPSSPSSPPGSLHPTLRSEVPTRVTRTSSRELTRAGRIDLTELAIPPAPDTKRPGTE
ncbi:MAG: serine/threonine protein kinase [Polyangiaceae bacterium]|nr:serine/threonine protein kinase [Polyangiaceae bacterium]